MYVPPDLSDIPQPEEKFDENGFWTIDENELSKYLIEKLTIDEFGNRMKEIIDELTKSHKNNGEIVDLVINGVEFTDNFPYNKSLKNYTDIPKFVRIIFVNCKIKSLYFMFDHSSLQELVFKNCIINGLEYPAFMSKIRRIVYENVDTSNVTSIIEAYYAIEWLEEIIGLEKLNIYNQRINSLYRFLGYTMSLPENILEKIQWGRYKNIKEISEIIEYTKFKNVDLSELNLDVNKVDMRLAFSGCSNMKTLKLPSKPFEVGTIESMFDGCSKLEILDISMLEFDNDEKADFYYAFYNMSSLKKIIVNIEYWLAEPGITLFMKRGNLILPTELMVDSVNGNEIMVHEEPLVSTKDPWSLEEADFKVLEMSENPNQIIKGDIVVIYNSIFNDKLTKLDIPENARVVINHCIFKGGIEFEDQKFSMLTITNSIIKNEFKPGRSCHNLTSIVFYSVDTRNCTDFNEGFKDSENLAKIYYFHRLDLNLCGSFDRVFENCVSLSKYIIGEFYGDNFTSCLMMKNCESMYRTYYNTGIEDINKTCDNNFANVKYFEETFANNEKMEVNYFFGYNYTISPKSMVRTFADSPN